MKILELQDDQGRLHAFEVKCFSRIFARRRVQAISGARLRSFSWFREVFCEFEIEGVRFHMWYPWNDSSRYWIGADPPGWVPQLEVVRRTFERARNFGGYVWLSAVHGSS